MTKSQRRLWLSRTTAEQAIESFRKGIPPVGLAREFTVGRAAELSELEQSLSHATPENGSALLLRANYGSGKTHMLRVIREMALDNGYAVAMVTVDSQNGVRFNRMDQVLSAVCRSIEVNGIDATGIAALFEAYRQTAEEPLTPELHRLRKAISNTGRWTFSEKLRSPAMYVGLRAWLTSAESSDARATVIDWFSYPDSYTTLRKKLFAVLVDHIPGFRDPREDIQFYKDEVFSLKYGGYRQCWEALADLNTLAVLSGLGGLVLLFDEFEDVVQNLNNRLLQQTAFLNLFRFFAGDAFPGMSYFAVTPEFVIKCQDELLRRDVYDFPFDHFEELPHFQMSKLRKTEFRELAQRVRHVHGLAYEWDAIGVVDDAELKAFVDADFERGSPDQVRQSIEAVVELLDDRYEKDG